MNYAIFTYHDDAECLDLCAEQIRRVDADAQIYVFDDAAAPFPSAPVGVHYRQTRFPRNGNLNGKDCILGILEAMQNIPGTAPVVKIDADTLLMNTAEIRATFAWEDVHAGGVACFAPFTFSGCCYWLDRTAIRTAYRNVAQQEQPTQNQWAEDRTICTALLYAFGLFGVHILPFNHGRHIFGINYTAEDTLKTLANRAKTAIAVHCGQTEKYAHLIAAGHTPRQACAHIMRRIIHYQNQ